MESVGPVDCGTCQSLPDLSRLEQTLRWFDSRIGDVKRKFCALFTSCLNPLVPDDKWAGKTRVSEEAIASHTCPQPSAVVYALIHPHGTPTPPPSV